MAGRGKTSGKASSNASQGTVFGVPKNVLLIVAVVGVAFFALNRDSGSGDSSPAGDGHHEHDHDGDGMVDAHELVKAVADRSGDGHVDAGELQAMVKKGHGAGTEWPADAPPIDPSLDSNGDGQIDAHELVHGFADKNGDGQVDRKELKDATTRSASSGLDHSLDADGDGDVDMDDMNHHMWRNIGIGALVATLVLYIYNSGQSPGFDDATDGTKEALVKMKAEFEKKSDEDKKNVAKLMFQKMDQNDDKELSHGEIKRHLEKDKVAKALLLSAGSHWKDFFKALDADGNNHITEDEFVEYYMSRASASK